MANRFSVLLEKGEKAAPYMIGEITRICREIGPRAPGSGEERKAAEYMAGILRKECGCSEVRIEEFSVRPAAFYGYFYFSMTFDVLCAALHFVCPLLSILSGAAALLLFLLQFVLYKRVVDPLFPKKCSVNVTAARPCRGETRRRVYLNGHIDSAWEFPLNYHFGGIVFEIPGVMACAGVLYYIALSVCALSGAGDRTRAAALWGLLFIPFFVLVGFTYDPRRVVDGANDNLSGCFIGISVLREMERLGAELEHTEVGVILTGSEEAGIRGAKAWAKARADDRDSVPTYIICFDTIHDPRRLMVNRRDLNGTVASDGELCDLFMEAAAREGIPCKEGMVPLFGGSTDSAAFTQGGFRSVGITGLNHRLEDYYHTRRDSYDNMDAEGLENCYRAAVSLLDLIDGRQEI